MKSSKQLKDLSVTDLQKRLFEFKKELLKLNTQVATGANAANSAKIKVTRKNIARVLTILKEKGVEYNKQW